MQIQSSCTESIADKLKVLYEHTVFEKGDPFFLWPQNSPGKMDTHARYLHYHNELELGWCTEGSGIFFVEDKVIPFQAPCASVSLHRTFPTATHCSPIISGRNSPL